VNGAAASATLASVAPLSAVETSNATQDNLWSKKISFFVGAAPNNRYAQRYTRLAIAPIIVTAAPENVAVKWEVKKLVGKPTSAPVMAVLAGDFFVTSCNGEVAVFRHFRAGRQAWDAGCARNSR
jgi:hypothetical protein